MDTLQKLLTYVSYLWNVVPRKLKYFLLGIALAAFNTKFPGWLPSIDPEWYVGGGLGLATLHGMTDMAYGRRAASLSVQPPAVDYKGR